MSTQVQALDKTSGPAFSPAAAARVSVVLPTHNRSALLARALRSVLAQTYTNLEVIVVDDASTDDTEAVVRSFDDPRIRYLRQETNKGGAATRNTGIRAATGDYIAFLDDDDEWEPSKTEEQLKLLEVHDAALCKYRMISGISTEGEKYAGRPVVDLTELRRGFLRGGGTSALVARAHVLKETLFDETLPRCQDWDLCIRIAQKHSIGYLPRPLVRFNNGEHDRISNKVIGMATEELERELCMLHKHRQLFGEKWYRRHVCRFMLYGIRHRPDKGKHLAYVVHRYGVGAVLQVFMSRIASTLKNFRLAN